VNTLEKIRVAKINHWEELDLSFGELTYLPKEIGELTSLKEVNLSSNQITSQLTS
jgi:Leucine-rich repeat (LRR) protein